MDRKTTSIVGAAAAVLAAGPALASPSHQDPAVPVATSYAELLAPIPDAAERLSRADAEAPPPQLIQAQYTAQAHHHHHHHHSRRWYRQHGYIFQNGAWILAPRPHHHHHDHNDRR